MKELKLAPTFRSPNPDEIPNSSDVLAAIDQRKQTNFVEGFILKRVDSNEFGYKFYAEINIDNYMLWLLLKEFILLMPQNVALIYGHIDDSPKYGNYLDKYELINKIESYSIELTQDGFLEFGVICSNDNYLEEIFIKKAKYVQYWGVDENNFLSLMDKFDLRQFEKMNFIDEFPLVTESLKIHNTEVRDTFDVIQDFDRMFAE